MASLEDLGLNKELYRDLGITTDTNQANASVNASLLPSTSGTYLGETSAESLTSGEINGDLTFLGGFIQSKNFASGSTGWKLDADGNFEANTGTFRGSLVAGSIDIPDTVSTASFHVDGDGNMWIGATTFASAPAKISKDGQAVFSNVAIGGTTIQYVITNSGIFSFGDGSDGDVTTSGNVTLTADKYYNNLTVTAGDTVNPAGYRIFVKNTLTLNGAIARNGATGDKGTDGGVDSGGGGATSVGAMSDGYLKGSPAPGAGGIGRDGAQAPTVGANGTNTTNSLGTNASGGGKGGNGNVASSAFPTGANGGTGGTVTLANVKLIANWHLATLLDVSSTGATIKFDNSASSAGGGGGAGDSSQSTRGGGGGSGGQNGGILALYARSIIISATGSITANGGVGGAGGDTYTGGGAGQTGGGGGAGGGNGGILVLVYNSLTNAGSITASAGTGGAGGQKAGTGTVGTNGTAGSAGTIYQFQLSL